MWDVSKAHNKKETHGKEIIKNILQSKSNETSHIQAYNAYFRCCVMKNEK